VSDADLSHLPPDVRARIERGRQDVSRFYDEYGKIKSPEQMEDDARKAAEAAAAPEPGGGGDDPAPERREDTPSAVPGVEDTTAPAPEDNREITETKEAPLDDKWEQRYKTLQGKFNQTTRELADRDARLMALERQMADLAKSREPAKGEDDDFKPLSTEERNLLDGGENIVPLIERLAYHAVNKRLAGLEQRISELGANFRPIEQTLGQVRHDTLSDRLTRDVGSDWRRQDEDPAFIEWLDAPDGFSGVPRKQFFKTALDRGDHDRVVNIFKAFRADTGKYKAQQTAGRPADTPRTNGTGNGAGGNGKVPLDTLVAPGKGRSAAATGQTTTADKPLVKRSELRSFQQDLTRGRWHGDELARWNRYFDEAIAEGRVVDG
jgi:hypothetical protein